MLSQDRSPRKRPWVVIFILLSLLAHLLFVLGIILINHFMPVPKLKENSDQLSSVSLSLEQPPPPPAPPPRPPPPKHIFMPTTPDAQAKHKETLVESDNDSRLRSKSQEARDRTSIVPDVSAKIKHASNLHDSPNAPGKKPSPTQSTATAQNRQANSSPPSPQTPTQSRSQSQATKPTPSPQPQAKVTQENPAKATSQNPPKQELDANGLPVLPPLNAPTIAPRTQQQQASTAFSTPEVAQDTHGAVGTHGDDSPEAMATELGRYKAKVYRTVGALWYHKVDSQLSVLPVGLVHIQFTVYKDGSVTTKVLEGDSGELQLLLAISLNSIRESAPFDPFTDSMIKQVGDSYTDDFTFSIYGSGN